MMRSHSFKFFFSGRNCGDGGGLLCGLGRGLRRKKWSLGRIGGFAFCRTIATDDSAGYDVVADSVMEKYTEDVDEVDGKVDVENTDEFEEEGNLTYEDMQYKDLLLNPRNPIFTNERLEFDEEEDPLDYEWPFSFDGKGRKVLLAYEEIDPELKRGWEDEYFDVVTEGRSLEPDSVRGGDWANNRVPRGVPPRIKRYYANIVEFRLRGDYFNSILCYEKMLEDHFVHRFFVPYGVYHEMQAVYFKEKMYEKSIFMFRQIISRYDPRPCDVSIAMESFVMMGHSREALRVWDSLRLRPGFRPDDFCWISLVRSHAAVLDFSMAQESFRVALSKADSGASELTRSGILSLMLEVYAEYGWREEFFELYGTTNWREFKSAELRRIFVGMCGKLKCYEEALEWHPQFVEAGMDEDENSLMARMEAHCARGDFEAMVATFESFDEHKVVRHSECYSLVIRHEEKFGASDWYRRNIEWAKSMKGLAPTHRNFRNIFAASMSIGNLDEFRISAMMDFLNEKKIAVDHVVMEEYALSMTQIGKYAKGLEFFADWASRGIKPSIEFFIKFLELAPKDDDQILSYYIWRVVKEHEIVPTYGLADSVVRHMAPDRNSLGRLHVRREWAHWTKLPGSLRAFNRQEYESFDKYVAELGKSLPQGALDDIYHPLYNFQVHRPVVVEERAPPPDFEGMGEYKLASLPFPFEGVSKSKKSPVLPKLSHLDQVDLDDILA